LISFQFQGKCEHILFTFFFKKGGGIRGKCACLLILGLLHRSNIVDVGQDEASACSLLKAMALKIHELVGARMHHLSVCQWEMKLRLASDGPANGTWRVVTTNVTSHTFTVDVSCSL
jgi:hypothetical protein